MRALLLGIALLGGGGYYVATHRLTSADVERRVKATPEQSWKAFDLLLNTYGEQMSDLTALRGPTVVQPTVRVTSVPNQSIDYSVAEGGTRVLHLVVRLEPLAGGSETRMLIDMDLTPPPGSKVTESEIGRSKPYLLWQMNVVADEMVKVIESGKLSQVADGLADMRHRLEADPRYREAKFREEQAQREEALKVATAPMLDPDKAKVDPHGATIVPNNAAPSRYDRSGW